MFLPVYGQCYVQAVFFFHTHTHLPVAWPSSSSGNGGGKKSHMQTVTAYLREIKTELKKMSQRLQ
jgi:hypothetical protein